MCVSEICISILALTVFGFFLINLFLAALSLHCCPGFFLVVKSTDYSNFGAQGDLGAVTCSVVEHGFWGSQASVVSALGL